MYHSLLLFLATYFLLSHGKHPLPLSTLRSFGPLLSLPLLLLLFTLPPPPLSWLFFYLPLSLILTKKVQPSLFLLSIETPFDNGKVFGLWYVGNTVYTVSLWCALIRVTIGTLDWRAWGWPFNYLLIIMGGMALAECSLSFLSLGCRCHSKSERRFWGRLLDLGKKWSCTSSCALLLTKYGY